MCPYPQIFKKNYKISLMRTSESKRACPWEVPSRMTPVENLEGA